MLIATEFWNKILKYFKFRETKFYFRTYVKLN
jgi:hypothetical protein